MGIGAFFSVVLFIFELLVVFAQAWYILKLKDEGEIGGLRFAILFLICLLALLVVINSIIPSKALPDFLLVIFLFLPAAGLTASHLWEKGHEERIASGGLHKEIEKWKDTIQKYPGYTKAYVRLGELHLRLGEKDMALEYYKKALSFQPEDLKIKEQILFLESKTEIIPKLTRSDLDIAKKEFRKLPLVLGLVVAGVLGTIIFVYLLHVLPTSAVLIVLVLLPILLLIWWLLKQ